MNSQDTKNKILYNKMVKNAFGLGSKSESIFKHRLFFERDIAPEYKQLLGDSDDLRGRFYIGEELFESKHMFFELAKFNDKGWTIFKEVFYHAKEEHDINYQNYYLNKVEVRGNPVKIPKLLKSFYTSSSNNSHILFNKVSYLIKEPYFNQNAKKRLLGVIFQETEIPDTNDESYELSYIGYRRNYMEIYYNIKVEGLNGIKEVKYYIPISDDKISNIIIKMIDIVYELIGTFKMPKKNLQLVVSLNPIDWFLCSTRESWSSCLDLENHGDVFWQGLPSMIGDKNRAMVYLTTGDKKDFHGIQVDKVISRSWTLLMRSKEDNKTHYHFVREYPGHIGLKTLLEEVTGIHFSDKEEIINKYKSKKVVSRYYVEMLLDKQDNFSIIYMDTTAFKVAKKNKAKYEYGSYGYYKMNGGGNYAMHVIKFGKTTYEICYEDTPPLLELLNSRYLYTVQDFIEG